MEEHVSPPPAAASTEPKSRLETTKWLVATLALPLVLVWVTHKFGEISADRASQEQKTLADRAAADRIASDQRTLADGRLRAYSELLNKREEADMGVRSHIFTTLIGSYLDPMKGDLTRRLTVLELLAVNFDESLNLSPLFWQLDRELAAQREPRRSDMRAQLSRLATTVKEREVEVLGASGAVALWDVDLAAFTKPLPGKALRFIDPAAARATAVKECVFKVDLIDYDPPRHRFFAVVSSELAPNAPAKDSPCLNDAKEPAPKQWSFWIDEFDFPLINYTRLSATERFALVMTQYLQGEGRAEIALVFFPSSRGGARDRPFLDTVVNSLTAPVDMGVAAAPAVAPAVVK